MIKAAKRLIYAGAGIRKSGNAELYRRLLEKLNIPSVVGWCASTFENTHPPGCGRPGMMGKGRATSPCRTPTFSSSSRELNIRQVSYEWKNFAKNAFKIMVTSITASCTATLSIDFPIWRTWASSCKSFYDACEDCSRPKWQAYCRENLERYPSSPPAI